MSTNNHPTAEPASGNYVQAVLNRLNEASPDLEPDLARLYALLALTRGSRTSLKDVHDAWALWCSTTNPGHRSLVPFEQLTPAVQGLDRQYRDAIRLASQNSLIDNRPGDHLIDVAPDAPLTDACGCNQPGAVHQRGDAAFCRATLAAADQTVTQRDESGTTPGWRPSDPVHVDERQAGRQHCGPCLTAWTTETNHHRCPECGEWSTEALTTQRDAAWELLAELVALEDGPRGDAYWAARWRSECPGRADTPNGRRTPMPEAMGAEPNA